MITRIRIQNYRSFVDAEVKLRPFSLVVGANGAGKSNLLRFLSTLPDKFVWRAKVSGAVLEDFKSSDWPKHVNYAASDHGFQITYKTTNGEVKDLKLSKDSFQNYKITGGSPWSRGIEIPQFTPAADRVSGTEAISPKPSVKQDGSGTAQVLEYLKNGDREDLFESIEANFKRYVPEIDKLSLRTVAEGKKQIQVRERGLNELLPATELSEGTRLILCLLTIIHQEEPPPIILLEDIDRGLHPRLFEYMAPLMKDIAERHDINILATTHNPYLVDCFKDDKEAVIIVEKKDGASTLSTLADRLEGLDYDSVDPDDMPLGNLWFSGLVGGVPAKITRRPEK